MWTICVFLIETKSIAPFDTNGNRKRPANNTGGDSSHKCPVWSRRESATTAGVRNRQIVSRRHSAASLCEQICDSGRSASHARDNQSHSITTTAHPRQQSGTTSIVKINAYLWKTNTCEDRLHNSNRGTRDHTVAKRLVLHCRSTQRNHCWRCR